MNRKERRAAAKNPGTSLPGRPAPTRVAGAAPEAGDRFATALAYHQAGRLADAESLYRQICSIDPRHFEAFHYFGVLAGQTGRNDIAIDLIGRSLALKPDYAEARFNLGNLLAQENRLDQAAAHFAQVVTLRPQWAEAHHSLGLALLGQGMSAKAIECFARASALKPDFVEASINQGLAFAKEGLLQEAAARLRGALKLRPNLAELHCSLGAVLSDQGELPDAMACFERALAIKPDLVDALYNLGILLGKQGRLEEAAIRFERALGLRANDANLHNSLGAALSNLGKFAEAMGHFEQALALNPGLGRAHFNIGTTLMRQGRLEDAAARLEEARRLEPDFAETYAHLGRILLRQGKLDEAAACLEQALALDPDLADALNCRGLLYRDRRRLAQALADFDRAIAIKVDHTDAHNNRGNVLHELGRFAEALSSYEQALRIDPNDAMAHYNSGNALRELDRVPEALASYERALACDPDHPYAFSALAHTALENCDWIRSNAAAGELESRIARRKSVVHPFVVLGYSDKPELQLECARQFLEDRLPVRAPPLRSGAPWRHDKLRIAYLSSDFRRHAVAVAMAALIELHDRARFEVLGISSGPDDQSELRGRLVRAFDQFHDVQSMSDREVAELINERQIDIAVDLNGHTEGARPGILALRPAPVQAVYLGYPATTGADFIDYVIADKVSLPLEHQAFYTERIVHLPNSYLAHDSTQTMASRTPSRSEAGLPDRGFVFSCFNNSFKITPPVFDLWMRLLGAVDRSVLWLSQAKIEAMANLRVQARAQGIDPTRLIFAPKVARLDDHLARHRLADLFLDTLPYNAHSTARDALLAGLPVLTCTGGSFAGRVATSLLCTAGIPELATGSLAEYEALALRLASDASLLCGYKERLTQSRSTSPLFDTDRFRRHLESAYATMWEIQARGEAPRSFSVETLSTMT